MSAQIAAAVESDAAITEDAPLLRIRDLARSFGETQALSACSFDVGHRQIHALLGENGSGKSTVVKILSGVIASNAGAAELDGRPLRFRSPKEAQDHGVATVFQETLVVPELSIIDNVMMGTDATLRPRRWAASIDGSRVAEFLEQLGMGGVRLDTPVWQLALGQRQIVTIVRALVRPWRLLILDEATSALDVEDRDRFFDFLTARRNEGGAVLFISHRMEEIRRLTDRVTVLRSGVSIQTLNTADTPTGVLVRLMSGQEAATAEASSRRRTAAESAAATSLRSEEVIVSAKGLTLREGAASFDLSLRPGEILGLAGLEGHGQVRFLECLAGLSRPVAGSVEVREGTGYAPVGDLRKAFAHGLVYVPRDRKVEGLFLPQSVADNVGISVLGEFTTAGIVRGHALKRLVHGYVERLQVKTPSTRMTVAHLSGGNQQKVLLGRAMSARPRVLLLNDPLRGVDHGVKLDMYGVFERLAEEGVALVFLSTEIEELIRLCPRVAVFRDDALLVILEGDAVTQDALVAASFGHHDGDGAL